MQETDPGLEARCADRRPLCFTESSSLCSSLLFVLAPSGGQSKRRNAGTETETCSAPAGPLKRVT